MHIEQRLEELGCELPETPKPVAAYVPAKRTGNLVFVSGQSCIVGGKPVYVGKVGQDITLEQAQEAARLTALNLLAADPPSIARAAGPIVLTPHPGEASRLLGITVATLEADRLAAAGLSDAIKAARESVEYMVMHASRHCDILDLADALLPSGTFAEKEGTFTNYEGRVQKISKAIRPVGNSRPDFDIFAGLLSKAGRTEIATDPAKAFNLMAAEVQAFAGLKYEDLPAEGALIASGGGNE